MVEDREHDFLGKHRDERWTYLICLGLLIGVVIVVNVVLKNPAGAAEGVKHFFGLL